MSLRDCVAVHTPRQRVRYELQLNKVPRMVSDMRQLQLLVAPEPTMGPATTSNGPATTSNGPVTASNPHQVGQGATQSTSSTIKLDNAQPVVASSNNKGKQQVVAQHALAQDAKGQQQQVNTGGQDTIKATLQQSSSMESSMEDVQQPAERHSWVPHMLAEMKGTGCFFCPFLKRCRKSFAQLLVVMSYMISRHSL